MTRREAMLGLGAAVSAAAIGRPFGAMAQEASLEIVARSPVLTNGAAALGDGTIILNAPRMPGHGRTPSLLRVGVDGSVAPFPGNAWNAWTPGGDGRDALVCVNACRVAGDDSLWLIDQGTNGDGEPPAGAQKIVRFAPDGGEPIEVLRFDAGLLPPGARMNDLRLHGDVVYVTDSGLGGILVHDRSSGRTVRRLSGHPLLKETAGRPQKGFGGRLLVDEAGETSAVHSDLIEVSPDGAWLYFAAPSGPMRRIATSALNDPGLTDADLADRIETAFEMPTVHGTAMDDLGNVYLADIERRRVVVRSSSGREAVLVADERLVSPDAMFITSDRRLLIPAPQLELLAPMNGGKDATTPPFETFAIALPERLGDLPLGSALRF
ncbi:L-dopachrome tautomerase-related protein [Antarcticirhabdus aurantiaca]|uniref:Uncharacterized protein n=1 Tax=Antarcticirhabdus aurantiaca TaxID=2606717 RepID=A0ACD4NMY5_9HYPH|nr:L-dopachrome tautomerase-related protein [Antarcticirhabdus aurantiaca]WAJ28230.1 hypothetical protein OXU80_25990 [Jeongeuplla avenae]